LFIASLSPPHSISFHPTSIIPTRFMWSVENNWTPEKWAYINNNSCVRGKITLRRHTYFHQHRWWWSTIFSTDATPPKHKITDRTLLGPTRRCNKKLKMRVLPHFFVYRVPTGAERSVETMAWRIGCRECRRMMASNLSSEGGDFVSRKLGDFSRCDGQAKKTKKRSKLAIYQG